MPKSRVKTRANKKRGNGEEALSPKNGYGFSDPTPYAAVTQIIKKQGGIKNGTTNNVN